MDEVDLDAANAMGGTPGGTKDVACRTTTPFAACASGACHPLLCGMAIRAIMLSVGVLHGGIAWGHTAANDKLPPLRWAADAEGGAPYIFKDPAEPREISGFRGRPGGAVGKRARPAIEFHQYAFRSLVPGLQRGDFDFAMNGLEITPDRRKAILFSRPYYVYALQLVARADEKRFASLDECRKAGGAGGHAGRHGGRTAAGSDGRSPSEGLRQPGRALPGPGIGPGRCRAPGLADRHVLRPAEPEAEVRRPPLGQGYYAIALPQGPGGAGRAVRRRLGPALRVRRVAAHLREWDIWNDDQEQLVTGEKIADLLQESARQWTFSRYFPLARCEGAVVTVRLTLLSMLLAMAIGLPMALIAAVWPGPVAAGRPRVYVEFFRGIPVLLLLFFLYYGLPGIAAQLCIGRRLETAGAGGGHPGLRAELCGLRGGNLPRRHRLDPGRAMGGRRVAGHVAAALLPPHHPAAGDPRDPAAHDQRLRGPVQRYQHRQHHRRGGTHQAVPDPRQVEPEVSRDRPGDRRCST